MAVVDQQLKCFFGRVKTDNCSAKKYQNTTSTAEQSTMSYNQYKVQTLYLPQHTTIYTGVEPYIDLKIEHR
jgi:hypothetical protein